MSDIWLPGYERWELPGAPGQPYDELNDPKALLHTTEGTSVDGAVQAYRSYPPQLIVDPARKRKVQHIPLNRAGYALWNEDADDSLCYQVEIVGYASQSHLWSDEVLRWLGEELARPLHEYGGVPYVVVWKGFRRDGEMPYALASASSPLRLTQAELDAFSGFLGHQHVPGDEHWDPGGLNVGRILDYAQNKEELPVNILGQDGKWYSAEQVLFWYGQDLRRIEAKVDAMAGALTDDEAKILAAVRSIPAGGDVESFAAAVAAHMPEGMTPDQVRDALADVLRRGTEAGV
jgi:hypothetical protein